MQANELRKIRRQKGISISQMAKDIHVTKATLSRYENGITDMTTSKFLKVIDYLGYEIKEKV